MQNTNETNNTEQGLAIVINEKQITCQNKDILLEEYKICHDYAKHMDNMAWHMGAVLFPVSVAALAYLFSISGPQDVAGLIAFSIVSAVAIAVLWTWLQLFKRWLTYQKLSYYRMVEIEKEIGMKLVTYGYILGQDHTHDVLEGSDSIPAGLKNLFKRRFQSVAKHKTEQLVSTLMWILILSWILNLVIQFIRVIFIYRVMK